MGDRGEGARGMRGMGDAVPRGPRSGCMRDVIVMQHPGFCWKGQNLEGPALDMGDECAHVGGLSVSLQLVPPSTTFAKPFPTQPPASRPSKVR